MLNAFIVKCVYKVIITPSLTEYPRAFGGLVDTSDPVVMSSIPAMEHLFSFPLLPYPYMYKANIIGPLKLHYHLLIGVVYCICVL